MLILIMHVITILVDYTDLYMFSWALLFICTLHLTSEKVILLTWCNYFAM